ncbi:MAG: cupin domain-containing protein [Gaiellaceae bacterium]
MDATWQRLGHAAGTKTVGLNRVRVAPGKLPTPPHLHGASEELYYILGGSGLAWQDSAVHEIRPGDCVIHRANELAHTLIAGPRASTTSSTGRTTRRSSAGCRGRTRSAAAGSGPKAGPTTRGTSRHSSRRSPTEILRRDRRTSSTSTRSSASSGRRS